MVSGRRGPYRHERASYDPVGTTHRLDENPTGLPQASRIRPVAGGETRLGPVPLSSRERQIRSVPPVPKPAHVADYEDLCDPGPNGSPTRSQLLPPRRPSKGTSPCCRAGSRSSRSAARPSAPSSSLRRTAATGTTTATPTGRPWPAWPIVSGSNFTGGRWKRTGSGAILVGGGLGRGPCEGRGDDASRCGGADVLSRW